MENTFVVLSKQQKILHEIFTQNFSEENLADYGSYSGLIKRVGN